MSERTPPCPAETDRNLLFGILAVQMDFLSRDALIAAMHAWVLDKARPLGHILRDLGHLSADRLHLLDALVGEHLKAHAGDAQQSLAALSAAAAVRRDLDAVPDADLHASLAQVGPASTGQPPGLADLSTTGDRTDDEAARYRILRPHAKGGLGEVFVALDRELHREVALKEIQPRHAHDSVSRGRFLLEAEITGGLEHPGIVPVYGLGQHADGRPFYAMRFIKGDNLKEAAERFHTQDTPGREAGERQLALRQLLGRFIDVCNAVAYAHSRGVLHRDLKPGNVMLGKYGETLVVDWGLAKPVGRPEELPEGDEVSLRPSSGSSCVETHTGVALGTPAYMSPEQAAGRLDELGPASDIYSLGATLYALLTGRPPYTGTDVGEVLRQVQHGYCPPPRQVKPATPAALEAICQKAMALRPASRYATALELAADVEHWLADEPVGAYREPLPARLARWGRRHKTWVTGAAALLLTAVVALTISTLLIKEQRDQKEQALGQAEASAADARAQKTAADASAADARAQKAIAEASAADARAQKAIAETNATRAFDQEQQAQIQRRRAEANFRKAREAVDRMLTRVGNEKLKDVPQLEPLRRDLLRDALEFHKGFLKEKSEAPEVRHDAALAYLRVGEIHRLLGEQTSAATAYAEAAKLYEKLAAEYPRNRVCRQELAALYNNQGGLTHHAGQLKAAAVAYRRAEAALEKLVEEMPFSPIYRSELSKASSNLGAVLLEDGQPDEAEKAYRKHLSGQEAVASVFWLNFFYPEYRRTLTICYNNLGLLLIKKGDHVEAERMFRAARPMIERLTQRFPRDAEYRRELATVYVNLGGLLSQSGRHAEAEPVCRAALPLLEGLIADFPRVPQYRSDLVVIANNLAILLLENRQPAEAEKTLRRGMEAGEKLLAEQLLPARDRHYLAGIYYHLGYMHYQGDRREEAVAVLHKALPLLEKPAGQPAAVTDRMILGRCYHLLGALIPKHGPAEDALKWYDKAIALFEELLKGNPLLWDARIHLPKMYEEQAEILLRLKRDVDADKVYRKYVPLQELLVAVGRPGQGDAFALGKVYTALGEFAFKHDRPREAVEWYGKAVVVLQRVRGRLPQSKAVTGHLLLAHLGKTTALLEQKRFGEAAQALRAASELEEGAARTRSQAQSAFFLALAGEPARAAAEADVVAEQAEIDGATCYLLARVQARACKAATKDEKQAAAHAARAVALLRRAQAAGRFKEPAQVEKLKKEADLAVLRPREEFKQLVSELEKK